MKKSTKASLRFEGYSSSQGRERPGNGRSPSRRPEATRSGSSNPPDSSVTQARELSERAKELRCLYEVSRLLRAPDAEIETVFRRVAAVVPLAWQHPEVAGARIRLKDETFSSEGFRQSKWQQRCSIVVEGQTVGDITVSYSGVWGEPGASPFLPEERKLLKALAQELGLALDRHWTHRRVVAYQEQLRALAVALSLSEERERRRFAEALHDRIGQSLALLELKLKTASGAAGEGQLRSSLREASQLVTELIPEVRALTFQLCPPILYDLGLEAALEWLAEEAAGDYGFEVGLETLGQPQAVPEPTRVVLFKAVQELLLNAAKHAAAEHVSITVNWEDEGISILVEDDGVGLAFEAFHESAARFAGFGLFNIKERLACLGGRLDISPAGGPGSRFRVFAPLPAAETQGGS